MNQKLIFITYSDNKKFDISKKHLVSLVKQSKFFDKIFSYEFKDLDDGFKKKYQNILSRPRGGGYWLWKMHIIEKTMSEINNGDILLYMDAGSTFNFYAKKRFFEYIDILNSEKEIGNFRFESEKHHIEKDWTSKELFSYFNISIDSDIANSTQFEGGHLLFKKNEHTMTYIKKYFDVINFDNELITDFYNFTPQIDSFKECRHDQSILSLLSKQLGCSSVTNETDFRSREKSQFEFPILAVRKKGHGLRDKILYNIFFGYFKRKPAFFKVKN